jgi:hypothetical protein
VRIAAAAVFVQHACSKMSGGAVAGDARRDRQRDEAVLAGRVDRARAAESGCDQRLRLDPGLGDAVDPLDGFQPRDDRGPIERGDRVQRAGMLGEEAPDPRGLELEGGVGGEERVQRARGLVGCDAGADHRGAEALLDVAGERRGVGVAAGSIGRTRSIGRVARIAGDGVDHSAPGRGVVRRERARIIREGAGSDPSVEDLDHRQEGPREQTRVHRELEARAGSRADLALGCDRGPEGRWLGGVVDRQLQQRVALRPRYARRVVDGEAEAQLVRDRRS